MREYRELAGQEIGRDLFRDFVRHQKVTNCWRKEEGVWVIREAPFLDDWSEEDYGFLVSCLKHTAATGGFVYACFQEGALKGFASVESGMLGGERRYMDLSCLHVSEELRGQGIGKRLFQAAKDWARRQGAERLYISGHSAVETQAFYRAMGCVEAQWYCQAHVEKEPFDCQLECQL